MTNPAPIHPREQKRWEVEKNIVYSAYDNFQVLVWAIHNPPEWRRKKQEVKRVKTAYVQLGHILRDQKNGDIIATWFGDDTGAVISTMKDVRESVRRYLPKTH